MPARLTRSAARRELLRKDARLRQELRQAMYDTGEAAKQKFEAVVQDWKHKPKFIVGYSSAPEHMAVKVFPQGPHADIWRYVDEGTEPHVIRPRRPGGVLVFRGGYTARTAATAKVNPGGGVFSGEDVFARTVRHPGSEARDFTGAIEEEMKPEFRRIIENAFRRALR